VLCASPAFCANWNIDTSGIKGIFGIFLAIVTYVAAIGIIILLATAWTAYRGEDYSNCAMRAALALTGAVVLAFAPGWINSVTGQNIVIQPL
jgi:hypothetical protein